jgi:peptide/nickel transport system substrate-binding protein
MKKKFLLLALLLIFSLMFAACGPAEEPAEVEEPEVEETEEAEVEEPEVEETVVEEPEETVEVSAYKQAPMLDAMDLPPVEERLPEDIMVITPVESIGKYGGTWNNVTWDKGAGNIKMSFYDPPVRWKADLTGYEPGLLIKMPEWSEDGQTITFTFRKGIKWSDGMPFTTADLQFWWEELALNEDYKTVNVPWWARNTDGTPITMEFPDEITWVLKFDKPQYIMPYVLAQGFWEWEPLMKPAHFLKQYHPDYEGQPGEEGYTELDLMDRWFQTPGYPCLMAWCLEEYVPGETWTFARNPYYWKVDTEGNQLPYLDYVRVEYVEDNEVRTLQLAQGRYDCNFRANLSPKDIPFFLENAEAGDFRLVPGWMNGAGAWPGIIVNQDYHSELEYDPETESEEDVEIRELLRNQDFRIGLSYAMDRERAVNVVWDGIGEAKQFTISPQSPHFASTEGQEVYDRWATSYAEYDTELAIEHFEKAGFVDADGDGIRDLPSGKKFTLIIDLNDWSAEQVNTEFLQVYEENLKAVGIDVLINNVVGEPGTAGDYGLYMLRTTHASELDLWTYPDWIFPVRGGGEGTRAFPQQGLYYSTGGEQGWEPEPGSPAARLQEIYRQGLTEPSEEKRTELIWEAVDVYIEQGPFILGAAGDQPQPVVCKNYFKNVYEYGVLGPWAPGTPGNSNPEQYFIDK